MAYESEGMKLEKSVIEPGVVAVFNDEQESKGFYLIAEGDQNEALGCLLITTEWSDWRNGTMLWIQSLFVVQEARRQGVFKKMYLYLQELVNNSSTDYRGIRLYVEKDNLTATEVYKSIGMDGEHYNMFQWTP
jgi:GNAT superfamily N-acetyltransferase